MNINKSIIGIVLFCIFSISAIADDITFLSYPNTSRPNMKVILGDYNSKFEGMFDFWFIFLWLLGLIIFSQISFHGFAIASTIASLVITLVSMPFMAMQLISATSFYIFASVTALSLFMFYVSR